MDLNLPVITLSNIVLMPHDEIKLEFSDDVAKSIVDESLLFHDNSVLVVANLSIDENILISSLPKIGTLAKIIKKIDLPNGKVRITLRGIKRAHVIEYVCPNPEIIESIVRVLHEKIVPIELKEATLKKIYQDLDMYIKNVPYMSNSIISLISETDDISKITDIIVSSMPIENDKKILYLLEGDVLKRVQMILEDMYREQKLYSIENEIDIKVKKEIDNEQKNLYLKEKIKQLKDEIGESSLKEEEISKLKERLKKLDCDQIIRNKILYEINRYENMSSMSPEFNMIRSYIEFMLELPWNIKTKDIDDISVIKDNLDKDHYGLSDVKDRIIEYLALKKQSKNINSPIICLVGPPGVGKTSIAYKIAEAMGRNFVKISVGGVEDEAIIRGHIRTYIGALPGRIIDGIKRAKSSNPVFLIDEIDKISPSYKGDPNSALLEVLDKIQNKHFKDNYIEEEYDLSDVFFITTANDIYSIPKTLKDRLEIINISGYTELDKISIAKDYMIPRICNECNIKTIKISDVALIEIIRHYTRESGLRELERCISKIVRRIIKDKILNNKKMVYSVSNVSKYLGKRKYESISYTNEIGIINALSVNNSVGNVIKVETNYYKGSGKLIVTGSLGEVLNQSISIALSYVKANYKQFGIDDNIFSSDIHVNVPNISAKKEGPCAGLAITTSIISSLTNKKIGNNIAFTGEITLRGNILKVGSLKEKIIGAYINGIDTIFIPSSNISELDEIPEEIKERIKFILVDNYIDVFNNL